MAVRFDAAADGFVRTANLPSPTAFTAMGWFKITTDRNAFSTFLALDNGRFEGALLQTLTDGTTLNLYTDADNGGSALTVGTWYHLAMTGDASNLKAYINGALDITASQWAFTPSSLYLGNDVGGEWLNGCAAYVKIWSAALTAAEIQAEVYRIRPARTADLYNWTPLLPGATERLRDYSGNGYDWTALGTLTDEGGPPVGWGAPSVFVPVVSSATVYMQAVGGSLTPAGGLSMVVIKGTAGSLTASGVVRRQTSKGLTGSLTPSGGPFKQVGKGLVGSLTASGVVRRQTSKGLTGSLTPSGGPFKQVGKGLAGSLIPSGVVGAARTFLLTLVGSLTPSGSVSRQVGKGLTGGLTASGILGRQTSKGLTGGLTASGILGRQTSKGLTGELTATGGVTKRVAIQVGGLLRAFGSLLRHYTLRRKVRAVVSDALVTVAAPASVLGFAAVIGDGRPISGTIGSGLAGRAVIGDGWATMATVGDSISE
jgi:hypothetical protein